MQIVKDIYLDFYQSEPVLVTAKEGDVGRFLHVTLLDNGNIFPVPSGSTVTFSRDDVWNGCTVNDDGTIMAPITADMRPGRVPAQIEVSSGNDHLSSWNFILDVQNSARNDSAIEGNNDFSAIQTLLDQVQDAIDNTNTAIANVNAAIANMGQNFASLANTQNITQLATNAKTLVGGINELNSKTNYAQYIKEITVNEEYQEIASISLTGSNLIVVCALWDVGKPTGLKITDGNGKLTYAISETDNGYQCISFIIDNTTLKIFEKLFIGSGTGKANICVITLRP